MQPSNLALLPPPLFECQVSKVFYTSAYPSSTMQWSNKTEPVILTIFPMVQCLPMTDLLIVVRSEI